MSAKDPPVARKLFTPEQLKAFAEQLRRNGPPGAVFLVDCECVPYGTCPICTAKRGRSVPHDEEGE